MSVKQAILELLPIVLIAFVISLFCLVSLLIRFEELAEAKAHTAIMQESR